MGNLQLCWVPATQYPHVWRVASASTLCIITPVHLVRKPGEVVLPDKLWYRPVQEFDVDGRPRGFAGVCPVQPIQRARDLANEQTVAVDLAVGIEHGRPRPAVVHLPRCARRRDRHVPHTDVLIGKVLQWRSGGIDHTCGIILDRRQQARTFVLPRPEVDRCYIYIVRSGIRGLSFVRHYR